MLVLLWAFEARGTNPILGGLFYLAGNQASLFDSGQAAEEGNTTLLQCHLCGKYAETKSHLFLFCRVTKNSGTYFLL